MAGGHTLYLVLSYPTWSTTRFIRFDPNDFLLFLPINSPEILKICQPGGSITALKVNPAVQMDMAATLANTLDPGATTLRSLAGNPFQQAH